MQKSNRRYKGANRDKAAKNKGVRVGIDSGVEKDKESSDCDEGRGIRKEGVMKVRLQRVKI